MTVERLKEANALHGQIEKAKEMIAMLQEEGTAIVSGTDDKKIPIEDGELRKRLVNAVNGLVESLEFEFRYFTC